MPLKPKTTGAAAATGSIVGSTRLAGVIGAGGGVVGGVGFMASSRSLAVDKPGGTKEKHKPAGRVAHLPFASLASKAPTSLTGIALKGRRTSCTGYSAAHQAR